MPRSLLLLALACAFGVAPSAAQDPLTLAEAVSADGTVRAPGAAGCPAGRLTVDPAFRARLDAGAPHEGCAPVRAVLRTVAVVGPDVHVDARFGFAAARTASGLLVWNARTGRWRVYGAPAGAHLGR